MLNREKKRVVSSVRTFDDLKAARRFLFFCVGLPLVESSLNQNLYILHLSMRKGETLLVYPHPVYASNPIWKYTEIETVSQKSFRIVKNLKPSLIRLIPAEGNEIMPEIDLDFDFDSCWVQRRDEEFQSKEQRKLALRRNELTLTNDDSIPINRNPATETIHISFRNPENERGNPNKPPPTNDPNETSNETLSPDHSKRFKAEVETIKIKPQ